MSIAVVCTSCSAKLNAPDSAAGKRVKCPKCQTALLVPEELPEASPFEVVDDEPQAEPKAVRPKVKATVEADDEDDEDRPRRRRARDEDDDEEDDDRPRKKKKKAAADNSMLIRNVIGGVVLLALLGVAGFVYYDKFGKKKDENTASNSSDEPAVANPRIVGPAANLKQQGAAGVPGGIWSEGAWGPNPGGKLVGTPGAPSTFNSPAGFKITFPGPYQMNEAASERMTKRFGGPVSIYEWQDSAAKRHGSVFYAQLRAGIDEKARKKLSDDIVKGLAGQGGVSGLISRRTLKLDGQTWEEMVFRPEELQKATATLRVLLTDKLMVLLLSITDKTSPADTEFTKDFFASFQLTK